MTDEKTAQKLLIQEYIKSHKYGYKLALCNAYLFTWESDLLFVGRNNKLIEVEIKVSRHDYLKDAEKVQKHNNLARLTHGGFTGVPNQFYYCVLQDFAKSVAEDLPDYAGLIVIMQRGLQKYVKIAKKAPLLHNESIEPGTWEQIAIKLFNKTI